MEQKLLLAHSAQAVLLVHVTLRNRLGHVMLMIFVQAMIVVVDSVAIQRDRLPDALLATLLLMVIAEYVMLVTIVFHTSATSVKVARQALPDPHHRPLVLLRKKI